MGESDHHLKTIQQAFRILDLLKEERQIGVTEVGQRLDLHKSTAHGYLRTLRSVGLVEINDDGYCISSKFLEFGGMYKLRQKLFHVSRQPLWQLAQETEFEVNVAHLEIDEVVILHIEQSENAFDIGNFSGMRVPAHSNATGKVILAHSDQSVVDDVLMQPLEPKTDHTITDPTELQAELETIREQEYAVDSDEQVVGMGVIAAPVLVDDDIHGAVSLVCPSGTIAEQESRSGLVNKVIETANKVSVNYRYSSFEPPCFQGYNL